MTAALYKITSADGSPCHGGSGAWDCPNGHPGAWRSVAGELKPCENGLHLCEAHHLSRWLKADAVVWEAETRGERIDHDDKLVVAEARLVARVGVLTSGVLRLFVLECAEKVLPIFEAKRPGDDRPRKAIEAARAFIAGKITRAQLRSAANAAYDAAYAANAAAYAAAAAASAAAAAAYAAANAAAYAADATADAADAAADADARTRFREWAGGRLLALLAEQEAA